MNKHRYEVIDRNDIVCAVADLKADALHAVTLYPGSYAYDTLTRRVVK